MGMKPNTSQAQQTLAALRAYGLLDTQRAEGGRAIVVSDEGRTYLRAQQDSIKQGVIRRAALRPKQIEMYWRDWGTDRPADAACRDALVLRGGFSPDGAEKFLRVYDATIAYAKLNESDKDAAAVVDNPPIGGESEVEDVSPSPTVKVGDYVQWTSGGVDQFTEAHRVTQIEGDYALVHGSRTVLPMSELTVVVPPVSPSRVDRTEGMKPEAAKKPLIDANVLISGGTTRLQITADVDLSGLKKLRELLAKYEEMFTLMATPMNQFEEPDDDR